MQWSTDLQEVKRKFSDLGHEQHNYMYLSWLNRDFPVKAWKSLGDEGFFNATVRHGYKNGIEWLGAALQGFSFGSQDAAFNISTIVQAAMSVPLIAYYASERAKKKYLDRITSGRYIVSFCVTESENGGTDAFNPQCTFVETSSGGYVTGEKWHITNAGNADLFCVWCYDNSSRDLVCVLVDRSNLDVHVGEDMPICGARTSPVAPVLFDNAFVPKENIIRFDSGKNTLNSLLTGERMLAAFPALGIMEANISKALGFLKERRVGNHRLLEKQAKQYELVTAETNKNIIAALARDTLDKYLRGESVKLEASQLKLNSIKLGVEAVEKCKDICGSYGLAEEAQMHMHILDGFVTSVGGGTHDAHTQIMFGEILKQCKNTLPLRIDQRKPWQESLVNVSTRLEKVS